MKIGITYDLQSEYLKMGYGKEETAEFDKEETIESIEHVLLDFGFQTCRIGNIRSLITRLAAGERWDLVFNIAEGMHGYAREAQVPAVLEAYEIPYTFSDPMILSLALHKGMTKQIIQSRGIPTPAFAVVGKEEDVEKIRLPFPLFAKPVAEGTSKGISPKSKIGSQEDILPVCRELLNKFHQPVLVERFLPGREFTVGIVGTGEEARCIGTLEIFLKEGSEKEIYSYWNKQFYQEMVEYRLARDIQAEKAQQVALAAWNELGCRDAGRVDLREDEKGSLHFLEVNPLPGLHPVNSDLPILCTQKGVSYKDLIHAIVTSAWKRSHSGKKGDEKNETENEQKKKEYCDSARSHPA
jgi:D-alanine-D-alanine ligase